MAGEILMKIASDAAAGDVHGERDVATDKQAVAQGQLWPMLPSVFKMPTPSTQVTMAFDDYAKVQQATQPHSVNSTPEIALKRVVQKAPPLTLKESISLIERSNMVYVHEIRPSKVPRRRIKKDVLWKPLLLRFRNHYRKLIGNRLNLTKLIEQCSRDLTRQCETEAKRFLQSIHAPEHITDDIVNLHAIIILCTPSCAKNMHEALHRLPRVR